jgi:hypothetical protein
MVQPKKKSRGALATGYLALYNIASAAAWAYVIVVIARHFYENG